MLLPDHITELKHDHFYSGLPKWFKVMVAYLKASTNEKTYSDYLWATQEAEKEEIEAMDSGWAKEYKQKATCIFYQHYPVQTGFISMNDRP